MVEAVDVIDGEADAALTVVERVRWRLGVLNEGMESRHIGQDQEMHADQCFVNYCT
jgi:hypothetical protein